MQPEFRTIEKSATLLLNEQSRALEQAGKQVFAFGFGQSPFPPFAPAVDSLQAHAGRKEYSPVQGLAPLREQVASFHTHYDQVDYSADNVLIAPGSKLLLYAAMAAYAHARVLVPAPAWVSYAPQAMLIGHEVVRLPVTLEDDWRVTPEILEEAMHNHPPHVPVLMVLNYPGNPSGTSYTGEQLKALAEVLERHQIMVISDEIYGLLHHEGAHVSLAQYYPQGTFVTGGLSKWCGAGGWRLGVGLMHDSFRHRAGFKDAMLGIASETYSCAPVPVQWAALDAYAPGEALDGFLQAQRAALGWIGRWSAAHLREAGALVAEPQGGFYLFVDFTPFTEAFAAKGWHSSADVCAALLEETGVAILPGEAFGMPASHICARLAFVDFDGAAVLEAARAEAPHEAWLKTHFATMRKGVTTLAEWLRAL